MNFSINKPLLLGVVHLKPLPGSPRASASLKEIIKAALTDAKAYQQGGADAVIIENFGDIPFTKGRVPAETCAAMAVAGQAVREAIKLPMGFNVLRNDPLTALGLCAACGGDFIRINVHSGAMITDQGVIESNAFETLRKRRELGLERVKIFADVHVKHATTLGNLSLEDAARDTLDRALADGLIVSGVGTGHPTAVADLRTVRKTCPKAPVLLGSGVTIENVETYLGLASGFIVGSSLKRGGKIGAPVDPKRVAKLAAKIRR
jgi:membrane complex biogenesis BtpA family protein